MPSKHKQVAIRVEAEISEAISNYARVLGLSAAALLRRSVFRGILADLSSDRVLLNGAKAALAGLETEEERVGQRAAIRELERRVAILQPLESDLMAVLYGEEDSDADA